MRQITRLQARVDEQAAVYAPIAFVGGLTGTLFTQFAFTVAGAVIVSGGVALTLSPMLYSKFLKAGTDRRRGLARLADRLFKRVQNGYVKCLHGAFNYRPLIGVMILIVLASCYFLYSASTRSRRPKTRGWCWLA